MKISVKVIWKVKNHSGWVQKDVEDEEEIKVFFEGIKPSICRGIDVPVHRKLVNSLFLFDQPKKDGMEPLIMNKTFKETFGSDGMPKKLELYTDYYSDRSAKRKRED